MNAIFFRAPNISSWETVPKRRQLEAHCLKNTQEIIAAIQPRLIVLNGMKTLKFFAVGDKDLEYNGRVLTRTTQIQIQNTSAIPAIATLHLSGARIPAGARAQIAQRIREKAGVLQI
jgi:hypothetical protein